MKNVSKIALAVFAAVGLAACSSNNGSSVEHFATYSKTEQGVKDLKALKDNAKQAAVKEETKGKEHDGELVVGSKTDATDHQYAQFGVFRKGVTAESAGELRYSVVSTEKNKLDAASALAVLSAKDNKGQYKNPGIDANYTGKFAYSQKEKTEANDHLNVKVSSVTFTLNNDEIHGHTTDGDEKFLFENAKVFNNGGELAYTGDVTVIKDDVIIDEGKYTGFFAGTAPADAKVGYDKNTVKTALDNIAGKVDTEDFQGAFDGKKQ